MPVVQFSVPSGVYMELGKRADGTDMSPEQYAKYMLWYALNNGVITEDQVREAKRDFERKSATEKVMFKPKPFGAY